MSRDKKIDYLTKYLCLDCRKTLKRPVKGPGQRTCAHCGGATVRMGQKFKPPKLSDAKAWEVVLFLIKRGFRYDTIYLKDGKGQYVNDPASNVLLTVPYPTSMAEAEVFVEQYARYSEPFEQAIMRQHSIGR